MGASPGISSPHEVPAPKQFIGGNSSQASPASVDASSTSPAAATPSPGATSTAATTPMSVSTRANANTTATPGQSQRETELERKRARDRRSQQAMRDRNRLTIQHLTQQVADLNASRSKNTHSINTLQAKVSLLETENTSLKSQNAALQLSLMGSRYGETLPLVTAARNDSGMTSVPDPSEANSNRSPADLGGVPIWERPSLHNVPRPVADQIVQSYIERERAKIAQQPRCPSQLRVVHFTPQPDVRSLLGKEHRSSDDSSNVVADILRAYTEISDIPRRVAVFCTMTPLIRWCCTLDRQSWDSIPSWLQPLPIQASTPHSAWVDRIPWPSARAYLMAHPEITLDDFATPYSSCFDVNWPYTDESVVIRSPPAAATQLNLKPGEPVPPDVILNPVFAEHVFQLKNWTVGKAFRDRFPDLTRLIDADSGRGSGAGGRGLHFSNGIYSVQTQVPFHNQT